MVRIMKCLKYSQKAGEMEILKLEKVLSQVRKPKKEEGERESLIRGEKS